jgi:hypothetical protein
VAKWLDPKSLDYRWAQAIAYFGGTDHILSGCTGILDGTHCPVTFNAHYKSHLNVSKENVGEPWAKLNWFSKKLKQPALNTQVLNQDSSISKKI